MFGNNNPIKSYIDIDNKVSGAAFEKRWFESVIMVLKFIQNNQYTPVTAHKKLIEVSDGLKLVKANLNDKLEAQHMAMLTNIYRLCIQVINTAIQTKNMSYLAIVVTSLQVVIEPYYKTPALIQ